MGIDTLNSSFSTSASTRRFFHILDVAKRLHLSEEDRNNLVLYLEQQYSTCDKAAIPVALQEKSAHIARQIEEKPELKAAYYELKQKWEETEAQLSNPLSQFERLAGYKALPATPIPLKSVSVPKTHVPEALPTTKVQWLHVMRYAVAASVFFVASYGMLYWGSQQFTAEQINWASVETYSIEMENSVTRSQEGDETEQLYFNALQELRSARKSYGGLFPYYDTAILTKAKEKLQQVVVKETAQRLTNGNEPSLRESDAQFFLAKAHLGLGDTQQARKLLELVAAAGSMKTEDAKQLLMQLK